MSILSKLASNILPMFAPDLFKSLDLNTKIVVQLDAKNPEKVEILRYSVDTKATELIGIFENPNKRKNKQ